MRKLGCINDIITHAVALWSYRSERGLRCGWQKMVVLQIYVEHIVPAWYVCITSLIGRTGKTPNFFRAPKFLKHALCVLRDARHDSSVRSHCPADVFVWSRSERTWWKVGGSVRYPKDSTVLSASKKACWKLQTFAVFHYSPVYGFDFGWKTLILHRSFAHQYVANRCKLNETQIITKLTSRPSSIIWL